MKIKQFFARWLALALCAAMLLSIGSLSFADGEYSTENVKKIAVSEKPDRMVYVIGEEFSPEGGVLSVTYNDKSVVEVPMTDPNVTFSSTALNAEGSKSIQVTFGKKSTRINVTVSASGFTVSFDAQDGKEPEKVMVAGGAAVAEPEITREGYTLEGWFTDLDYKEKFDFKSAINEDTTLYAFWKKDGAEYVDVTFDYDYYGVKLTKYTRPVEKGTAVAKPADPVRTGYKFDGWYVKAEEDEKAEAETKAAEEKAEAETKAAEVKAETETKAAEGKAEEAKEEAYDFSKPVDSKLTLVAHWVKTVSGTQEYVFEAEDTDLTGKEGVGSSGVSTERSMIQFDADKTLHPSNSRWVGFLYKNGISLEFHFASDVEISDAKISLSLSTELPGKFTFDRNNYAIILNGTELSYRAFTLELPKDAGLESKTPFETFEIATGAHIQKGENTLVLQVKNNTTIQGTTYQAVGPMVDCVKIETEAVLGWDETKGLPAKNY